MTKVPPAAAGDTRSAQRFLGSGAGALLGSLLTWSLAQFVLTVLARSGTLDEEFIHGHIILGALCLFGTGPVYLAPLALLGAAVSRRLPQPGPGGFWPASILSGLVVAGLSWVTILGVWLFSAVLP